MISYMKTSNAERTVKAIKKKLKNGEKVIIGKEMMANGYSESSARAVKVKNTRAWKDVLEDIDDDTIAKRVEEFALNDSDKRLALDSAKEVFKLKNRYPTNKETPVTPQLNIVVKDIKDINEGVRAVQVGEGDVTSFETKE